MNANLTFEKELSTEFSLYFKSRKNGRFATSMAWIKAIFLLTGFFSLYFLVVFQVFSKQISFALAILWGIVSLLIIFNIGHDAVHNAFSRKKWINTILGYSFNLVGASAYSWYLKHNQAHHQFTNIDGLDHDTEMDPLMRVSPLQPYRWYYRWQYLYWPFVYAFFSVLIIFLVDLKIFFQEKAPDQTFFQPIREWIILVITKLFYLFYIFWIPIKYGGFSLSDVLIVFCLIHLINGIIIGLVFQPSHYFVESLHYSSGDKDSVENWHQHQLNTTVDISPDNEILSSIIGGLNTNVAHHLYPKVCHVHYPKLAAIIRDVVKRHGLQYYEKSWSAALQSHISLLKKLSKI